MRPGTGELAGLRIREIEQGDIPGESTATGVIQPTVLPADGRRAPPDAIASAAERS
jgi:hypothetical protein